MTLAILLLGLVIATCFIAYIADNIGKNMGKKRISIFGLRPRQTATLISMASSVLIMLATVGILMATSKSLSNALLNYDVQKREANRRQRENEKLSRQNADLQTNLNQQRTQIQKQNEEIKRNRAVVQRISTQRKKAQSNLETIKARLQKARANAASAQRQLVSARRQFQSFKAQLNAAKAQVAAAKSRVATAQAQVTKAQQQLQRQERRISSTNQKLQAAQEQLQARQSELANAKNALLVAQRKQDEAAQKLQQARQAVEKVQDEIKNNLIQINDFETTIANLEVRRDKLQATLDEQARLLESSKKAVNWFADIAQKIATGDIAVPQGEVFAERTIAANLSAVQVRAELQALMEAGREYLADPPRTLQLALPREAQSLSEDEFLNGFGAYLSTLGVPVSVRLLAARDHARGETEIFARLLPIVIRPIFQKGDVLGTAVIEADAGDARIFNQLLKLLNETEQRARERGVAPLPTRENPLFYPTGTNERVFEALRRIQSEGGTASVRLIAAEDISTVDSPRVRFEIERQTSP